MLVLFAVLFLWSYDSAVLRAEAEMMEDARASENQLLRVFEVGNLLLVDLQHAASNVSPDDGPAIDALNERLQRLVQAVPYVFRLFMLDANGDVYASSMESRPKLNGAHREYFQFHRTDNRALHVSAVLRSQASGEPIVTLSRRVSGANGEFLGVVLVSFNLDHFQEFARELLPRRSHVKFQIIGPGMQVIVDASPTGDHTGETVTAETQEHLLRGSATARYVGLDLVERIWAHRQIGEHPVYVRVGVALAQVVQSWRRTIAPFAALAAVSFFALATLSWLAVRHAKGSEAARRELDDANRQLERRVEERTQALQAANASLREANEALETISGTNASIAAELKLDRLVQTVTDAGVKISGAKFGAFFYNTTGENGEAYQLYTLSGAPREAFAGFAMPRNTQLFGPTFRGEGVIRIADVLADPRYGRNPPYSGMPEGHLPVRSYLAAPVSSRDGKVLGGLFFGHPEPGVFDERAEQAVAAVASQAALAVEKAHTYGALEEHAKRIEQALVEKDVLFQEIHHRVKNNLQIILSMLTLEAGRLDSPARRAFEKVEARIRSIALVHQTLYEQQQGVGVDMAQYLRDLADSLAHLSGSDGRSIVITVSGGGELPLNLAVPVGLIANEVISNACKHAFVGRTRGMVQVQFGVSDAEASLRVVDDGVGFCEQNRRHGTGLRIISALAQQIDAEWSYGGEGGCVFALAARLPGSATAAQDGQGERPRDSEGRRSEPAGSSQASGVAGIA